MYNFETYDTLRKCQRSFDMDQPVDNDTLNLLTTTANNFVSQNNLQVKKFFITDKNEIKVVHSTALLDYEPTNLAWKTNTQVLAPLLFLCNPLVSNDNLTLAHIGRLHSILGLIAASRGYKVGFCLCINMKAMDVWDSTKKYVTVDPNTGRYIPPIFLSFGKALDPTKPHNWSDMHRKFNPSHSRYIDYNITIRERV